MVATYDDYVIYYDKYWKRLSDSNYIKLEKEAKISQLIEPTK